MGRRYITRDIEPELKEAAGEFPVVMLTGPRQSGKSTLLQHVFADHNYITLDDPFLRKQANEDSRLFLENAGRVAVIDEIQYAPELLSYIKMEVDRNRSHAGKYILTGSQHFSLMGNVSETLAGRAATYRLLPFAWREAKLPETLNVSACFETLFCGFYPDPLVHGVDSRRYYSSYLTTYIERDIRQILAVRDLTLFQNFIELLAARAGSVLNLNSVSNDCGVSYPTVKRWLSLLESTGVVYLLRPYHKNVSKRVVKSPKLYFTDTGLLAHLLRYPNAATMQKGPMAGAFFENFIVGEALKYKLNHNAKMDLYFFRDSNRREIDLIIESGGRLQLVEIKMSKTPNSGFADPIKRMMPVFNVDAGAVILSFTDQPYNLTAGIRMVPWLYIYELLDRMGGEDGAGTSASPR